MLLGKVFSLSTDPQDLPQKLLLPRDALTSYSSPVISRELSEEWASQVALVAKNLSANAGDIRDIDSMGGVGKIP